MATVAVVGTGWMGRALGQRLAAGSSAPRVVFGSRHPERDKGFPLPGPVMSMEDAISASSNIVILAVPCTAHAALARELAPLLTGRVVVDVSNSPAPEGRVSRLLNGIRACWQRRRQRQSSGHESQGSAEEQRRQRQQHLSCAQRLQAMLPGSVVVKAFNTVSAYDLTSKVSRGVPLTVQVAGSDHPAVCAVCDLVQDAGMKPQAVGPLQASRALEEDQHALFEDWTLASLIVALLATFFFIHAMLWYLVLPLNMPPHKPVEQWDQLPLKVMNTIIACTGAASLGLVFLPGAVASIVQLGRGDAARAFPGWLASWMSCRKQLGLWAFWFLTLHAIMTCLMLSPEYFYSMFKFNMSPTPGFGKLNVYGETSLLLGVLAFGLLLVMTVNSVPAVGITMTYREWRCVFSTVGLATITLGLLHIILYSLSHEFCDLCQAYLSTPKADGGPTSHFYGSVWPRSGAGPIPPPSWIAIGLLAIPLVMRLLLALPPLSTQLHKLRSGGYTRPHRKLQSKTPPSSPLSSSMGTLTPSSASENACPRPADNGVRSGNGNGVGGCDTSVSLAGRGADAV